MDSPASVAIPQDQLRATKRKLDDAFFELDNSVTPLDLVDDPHPLKKTNASRSIYSTLTKYGILTKSTLPPLAVAPTCLTKPTPHLSAILARAGTRTKCLLSLESEKNAPLFAPMFSSNAEYRPSSVASFLSRLSTFKLATYANKPPKIDGVAASKCGWTNDGKDRLVCGICGASWVVAGRDGMSRDAASALVEKQRVSLVEAHKQGCPWKTRQCDPSIYRIPLQPPATTVKVLKMGAISLTQPLKDVIIKHPLTETQVTSVKAIILAYPTPSGSEGERSLETGPASESALVAALFGWSIVLPTMGQESRRSSFSSPSAPTPGASARIPCASTSASGTPVKFNPSSSFDKRDTLLRCALCQRRIGLWTFLPKMSITRPVSNGSIDPSTPTLNKTVRQRQFDLLREHRSYCPYVVRSTDIPALPLLPSTSGLSNSSSQFHPMQSSHDGTMEGWQAVLTVVLRYGLGQNYMSNHDIFAPESESSRECEDTMEVGRARAMIASVKSRGGKDLLKYVRGLLN